MDARDPLATLAVDLLDRITRPDREAADRT
jgi:hypothetical protein